MANLVLVDDHVLLRNGLSVLVRNLGHAVLFEANNGNDFIARLNPRFLPHIVLMDINMPEKDGFETTRWLKKNYPEIKVLALSMYDAENVIIRMLQCGAKGYILKDSDPSQLKSALEALMERGFYHSELVSGKLIHAMNNSREEDEIITMISLNEREKEFLRLVCTELTYKDIAEKMNVSPRTVDGYRDILFTKLGVKTRVGLVVYALRSGIAEL